MLRTRALRQQVYTCCVSRIIERSGFLCTGQLVSKSPEPWFPKAGISTLLVLDEFLLLPANDAQQRILLELLERRFGNVSTIFCSQYNEEGWHDQLGGSAIAESILDRITPNSYKITIQGDVSMRQRLGADD